MSEKVSILDRINTRSRGMPKDTVDKTVIREVDVDCQVGQHFDNNTVNINPSFRQDEVFDEHSRITCGNDDPVDQIVEPRNRQERSQTFTFSTD